MGGGGGGGSERVGIQDEGARWREESRQRTGWKRVGAPD